MSSHWINITTVDDEWEVEMDAYSSQYRHRPLTFPRPRRSDRLDMSVPREDWRGGRPPTGRHSRG